MALQDSLQSKTAAIQRGLASNQALLDEIGKYCDRSNSVLANEYFTISKRIQQLGDDGNKEELRRLLLRQREIRRTVITLSECKGGAQVHNDGSWTAEPMEENLDERNA